MNIFRSGEFLSNREARSSYSSKFDWHYFNGYIIVAEFELQKNMQHKLKRKFEIAVIIGGGGGVLCISTSFWVLPASKSWSNYFFSAVFNLFCSF